MVRLMTKIQCKDCGKIGGDEMENHKCLTCNKEFKRLDKYTWKPTCQCLSSGLVLGIL